MLFSRRMMMTSGGGVHYKSMFDAGSQIIAKEGAKSLFKGAGANILRGVAGAGVLSLYDKIQQVMFGKVYSGGKRFSWSEIVDDCSQYLDRLWLIQLHILRTLALAGLALQALSLDSLPILYYYVFVVCTQLNKDFRMCISCNKISLDWVKSKTFELLRLQPFAYIMTLGEICEMRTKENSFVDLAKFDVCSLRGGSPLVSEPISELEIPEAPTSRFLPRSPDSIGARTPYEMADWTSNFAKSELLFSFVLSFFLPASVIIYANGCKWLTSR